LKISIGFGSILRYVAGKLGWTVNGPVMHRVIGGHRQYWINFERGPHLWFIVYGEALPFFAAKASAYLHALRELELIGVEMVDLHHAKWFYDL